MIAVSSKAHSFASLARYLVTGRSGEERDRVAWSVARNLPTDDPALAAKIMRATAEQSVRAERPVYHLLLSFDPDDRVNRMAMEGVADRVLRRLGLHDHEAVYVSHRDREHPHVHLLVNRVHPITGRAWAMSFDYKAIQAVLREEERTLGLREVPGRYDSLQRAERAQEFSAPGVGREATVGREMDSPVALPTARAREGDAAFVERVRTHVPTLRSAPSWAELETVLAEAGLRLKRERRVLTITDGDHRVTASRVAPDLAMGRLEARFGIRYESYSAERTRAIETADGRIVDDLIRERPATMGKGAEVGLVPTVPLAVASGHDSIGRRPEQTAAMRIAQQLDTYEQVAARFGEHYAATHALSAARARLAQTEAAAARATVAMQSFERGLSTVYREPRVAGAAFERAAVEHGIDSATRTMRDAPERLGALLTIERRTFGVVRTADEGPARRAALAVATQGREAWFARAGATGIADDTTPRMSVLAAVTRERDAREALRRHPEKGLLEREIGRAMSRLLPHELEELRRVLSSPRFALAVKFREAVKDLALGREGQV